MKILKFEANKVYGYLNFNIDFDDKLSFLVGGNGSGKTTVLRLIQAVLTPNLKDIYLIPFEKIELTIEDTIKYIIKVIKTKDNIKISVSNETEELILSNKDDDELSYILSKEENLFNREFFHHRDHKVFKFIHDLKVPLFLGLDRRENVIEDEDNYLRHTHIRIRNNENKSIRRNRYMNGSLSVSLQETQDIIKSVYGKRRRQEDFNRKQLRDNILLTAFHYSDIDDLLDENNVIKRISLNEQKKIMSKKEHISKALKNIGFNGEKNFKEMEYFFEKIEKLFSDMDNNDNDERVSIEWLINKSQIDRIQKLIALIEKSNEKVEKSFKSINQFINAINHFLQDTGKSIEIDHIGSLKIKKPNGNKGNIDALSSGERQLIVMFSHLIFKNESNPSGVFIIDEPELSLHIDWQKDFIKYALESNPNTQLILATHSPDIVIGNEKKAILVKGKK